MYPTDKMANLSFWVRSQCSQRTAALYTLWATRRVFFLVCVCSRHWVGDTTAVMPGQTTCEMHNRWNCPTKELNFTRDRRPGFWTPAALGLDTLDSAVCRTNREKMRQSILSSFPLLFVESTGLVSIFLLLFV